MIFSLAVLAFGALSDALWSSARLSYNPIAPLLEKNPYPYSNGRKEQIPLDDSHVKELEMKWDSDWAFSGISTFGHAKHLRCLTEPQEHFDIGIIGAPFDSAATYRPGARLGPRAIRTASGRHITSRGFNVDAGLNPYMSWARVLDCGDIPITPIDNALAVRQMTEAFTQLGKQPAANPAHQSKSKLIILGGDHSVALPALRALHSIYNEPIALLHFDAHLDTLLPTTYPSSWGNDGAVINHGTMFGKASEEGLLLNTSSVHAGLRTRLTGDTWADFIEDDRQGFLRISTNDIDDFGVQGVIDMIKARLGTEIPVYLSIDIDVLDPAFAPGTGAPEPGGWTSRELIRILSGLRDINLIGADIVEVAPAYDSAGGDTAFVAAQLAYEIITNMVVKGLARDEH